MTTGKRMRYFCAPDDERLMAAVNYIAEHGGRVQLRQEEFAAILGMPPQALIRRVQWAEQFGLVSVVRTAAGFGTGRVPNTYTLLMTLEEWADKGEEIVAAVHREKYGSRKDRGEPKVRRQKMPEPKVPRADPVAEKLRAQAEVDIQAAIKSGALPSVIDPDELAAWEDLLDQEV